jgi:hypothetical protein
MEPQIRVDYYYDICVQPIFVTADETEHPFEGLQDDQKENRGANSEFRCIADTLRGYLGNNLDFEVLDRHIILAALSYEQMTTLRDIKEDTCDRHVKYGRSQLTFTIV